MTQNRMKFVLNALDAELSHMEVACLTLAANGYRPYEISVELNASEIDVENLFSHAERKLGAKNRLHAIGIAVSQGLIGIDCKK
jgi:DNA-binding CsgD family transcriptional regulator